MDDTEHREPTPEEQERFWALQYEWGVAASAYYAAQATYDQAVLDFAAARLRMGQFEAAHAGVSFRVFRPEAIERAGKHGLEQLFPSRDQETESVDG